MRISDWSSDVCSSDLIDGVEVAASRTRANDISGDGDGKVGFAGARAADQDDVAPSGQERAAVKRTQQAFINRCALEPERIDILHDRQPGGRHTVSDRGSMAMCCFRAAKIGQYLHRGALALKAGGARLVEPARHALE